VYSSIHEHSGERRKPTFVSGESGNIQSIQLCGGFPLHNKFSTMQIIVCKLVGKLKTDAGLSHYYSKSLSIFLKILDVSAVGI